MSRIRGERNAGPGTGAGTGSAADTVTTNAVIGGLILVPLLGWQNARLRAEQSAIASAATDRVDHALRRVVAMSALEGTRLSRDVINGIRRTRRGIEPGARGDLIVVAFTPNACGISLRQGLETLRLRENSDVRFHALVGEHTADDRVGALLLRDAGLMPFPVTFVPMNLLMDSLFFYVNGAFAEEPLYMRLDDEYRIVSVFEADQLRPHLLETWLEAIGE